MNLILARLQGNSYLVLVQLKESLLNLNLFQSWTFTRGLEYPRLDFGLNLEQTSKSYVNSIKKYLLKLLLFFFFLHKCGKLVVLFYFIQNKKPNIKQVFCF